MTADNLDFTILKTITSNKRNALDFTHNCNEKIFDPDVWRFAKTLIDYIKVVKEVPTKRVILERINTGKNAAFAEHVNTMFAKLDAINYDDREYKHDLEKLKNRYSSKLVAGLNDALTNSNGDLQKSISNIQSALTGIKTVNQVKSYEQKTLKESVDDFRNRYVEKQRNPDFGVGLMTGYSFLDFALSGLRPSEMLLIGGESGMGKSMMLINFGINLWLQGNTIDMEDHFKEGCDVLYFSLEMPFNDIQDRLISRLSLTPQKSIRDAKLEEDEKKQLSKAVKFIKKYPFEFEIVDVPRGASIETIETIFNDVTARRRKPKIIIIDYLTLMDYKGDGENEDWLKNAKISEQLHEFSRIHEVTVVSAIQLTTLTQGPKSGESAIGLHRIGRSRLIAHNADFVLQIEKRPNEEQLPDMNLHMIKSRRSELAKGKLYKNFACCALLNSDMVEDGSDIDDISSRIDSIGIEE